MKKIVVSEFMSLDGVIEAPENWHFPYITDDMQESVNAQLHACTDFLYGRATYEAFASFWPTQTQNEFGIADKLNQTPKHVVSTTLQRAEWQHSTIISENVIESIAALKQQGDGIIGLTGSATLVQSLTRAGLVDDYILWLHPIVVGQGKRLFPEGIDAKLKLGSTKVFAGGVVEMVYHPATA
jgi:dihydrofolate reductase